MSNPAGDAVIPGEAARTEKRNWWNVKRSLQTAALIVAPRLFEPGSHFIRTIILSRMLSLTDLGLTMIIIAVLSIAEMIGDLGLERFVMWRLARDDRRSLAACHALLILRSTCLAGLTLLCAPWIISMLSIEARAADIGWCAAVLFIRGFAHLRVKQAQRDFHLGAETTASLAARVTALAAVYPAALFFGDFRAIIPILLIDSIVYVVASHLLADVPYRITLRDRDVLRSAIVFGLPLMVNGLGLVLNSQVDRAVVVKFFGPEELAIYGVSLNLAVVPVSILLGVLGLPSMSLLSRANADRDTSREAIAAISWVYAAVAGAYGLFIAATLEALVPLVYGRQFAVSTAMAALISLIVCARLNRGPPTGVMLIEGRTRALMVANLTAGSGLLAAIALLPLHPQIETMLLCILSGDALSLVFLLAAAGTLRFSQSMALGNIVFAFGIVLLGNLGSYFWLPLDGGWRAFLLLPALALVCLQAGLGIRRYLNRDAVLGALKPELGPQV